MSAKKAISRGCISIVATMLPIPVASQSLPFPDGVYSTDRQYCVSDPITLGEDSGLYTRELRGNTIVLGFASQCSVENLRNFGDDILFDAECEAEGEVYENRVHFFRKSDTAFEHNGQIYSLCEAVSQTKASLRTTTSQQASKLIPGMVDVPGQDVSGPVFGAARYFHNKFSLSQRTDLQWYLSGLGFAQIAVDGLINEQAVKGLLSYQENFGLTKRVEITAADIEALGRIHNDLRFGPDYLNSSDGVIAAQDILTRLGFDPGPVDGKMGSKTLAAIIQFQKVYKLPVTGALDQITMDRISKAIMIKTGLDFEEVNPLRDSLQTRVVENANNQTQVQNRLLENLRNTDAQIVAGQPDTASISDFEFSGLLTQRGGQKYSVRIWNDGKSMQIDYPELNCGGWVKFAKKTEAWIELRETLTRGTQACGQGGVITLKKKEGSQWLYEWKRFRGAAALVTGIVEESASKTGSTPAKVLPSATQDLVAQNQTSQHDEINIAGLDFRAFANWAGIQVVRDNLYLRTGFSEDNAPWVRFLNMSHLRADPKIFENDTAALYFGTRALSQETIDSFDQPRLFGRAGGVSYFHDGIKRPPGMDEFEFADFMDLYRKQARDEIFSKRPIFPVPIVEIFDATLWAKYDDKKGGFPLVVRGAPGTSQEIASHLGQMVTHAAGGKWTVKPGIRNSFPDFLPMDRDAAAALLQRLSNRPGHTAGGIHDRRVYLGVFAELRNPKRVNDVQGSMEFEPKRVTLFEDPELTKPIRDFEYRYRGLDGVWESVKQDPPPLNVTETSEVRAAEQPIPEGLSPAAFAQNFEIPIVNEHLYFRKYNNTGRDLPWIRFVHLAHLSADPAFFDIDEAALFLGHWILPPETLRSLNDGGLVQRSNLLSTTIRRPDNMDEFEFEDFMNLYRKNQGNELFRQRPVFPVPMVEVFPAVLREYDSHKGGFKLSVSSGSVSKQGIESKLGEFGVSQSGAQNWSVKPRNLQVLPDFLHIDQNAASTLLAALSQRPNGDLDFRNERRVFLGVYGRLENPQLTDLRNKNTIDFVPTSLVLYEDIHLTRQISEFKYRQDREKGVWESINLEPSQSSLNTAASNENKQAKSIPKGLSARNFAQQVGIPVVQNHLYYFQSIHNDQNDPWRKYLNLARLRLEPNIFDTDGGAIYMSKQAMSESELKPLNIGSNARGQTGIFDFVKDPKRNSERIRRDINILLKSKRQSMNEFEFNSFMQQFRDKTRVKVFNRTPTFPLPIVDVFLVRLKDYKKQSSSFGIDVLASSHSKVTQYNPNLSLFTGDRDGNWSIKTSRVLPYPNNLSLPFNEARALIGRLKQRKLKTGFSDDSRTIFLAVFGQLQNPQLPRDDRSGRAQMEMKPSRMVFYEDPELTRLIQEVAIKK